jgi:energy-coupling factor transporter ATP-binding protein EcfA2
VHGASRFAFDHARVAVRYEAPGFAAWPEETLLPGFVSTAADVTVPEVVVRRGADVRVAGSCGGEFLGAVPCFVFDREVIHEPAWRTGDTLEITDHKYDAHYSVNPAAVIVDADGPWPRTRAAVLRVVRELALARNLADELRTRLHAAALEHDGRVLLLAGPKGAGKTTLLAHLASSTTASVVTNDCALVTRVHDGAWDVKPVPVSVSVRAETMVQLPHLFAKVPAVDALSQRTIAEADEAVAEHGAVTEPTRLKLSPALFAREVGSVLSPGGRLAAVAVVSQDPRVDGYRVEERDTREVVEQLLDLRYGASVLGTSRTIFDDLLGTDRLPGADEHLLGRLATDVPCVGLVVGPDLLRHAEPATRMLDDLFGLG